MAAIIERRNLKLVSTLTVWFLIVSILPAVLVFALMQKSLKTQAREMADHAMQYALRSKATELLRNVETYEKASEALANELDSRLAPASLNAVNVRSIITSHEERTDADALYFVGQDMRVTAGTAPVPTHAWLPDDASQATTARTIVSHNGDYLFIARRLSVVNAWLVAAVRADRIAELVRADINDRLFYSARTEEDGRRAFGETADIALFDSEGEALISPALYHEFSGASDSYVAPSATDRGSIVAQTYPVHLANTTYTLVLFVAESELLRTVYDSMRGQLLVAIGSLIGLLILLYIFVVSVGRAVVTPISRSVSDLSLLGEGLAEHMQGTEGVMRQQLSLSKKLVGSHTAQLSDMKKVNDELNAIVREFKTITAQTTVTASSAVDITDKARASGAQAQKAKSGIVDIRRLATSHEAMVAALTRYSREVGGIAGDIESLSRAISYLSLNATIEGSAGGGRAGHLTRLTAEAGNLARVSRESSERIHELLARIQKSLAETTRSARLEVESSHNSTAVINDALERLGAMSTDTQAIAKSVSKINALVATQRTRVDAIFSRSESVVQQAKGTMRSAIAVAGVAEEQRVSIRTTSRMLKRLRATVETLHNLIETKRT